MCVGACMCGANGCANRRLTEELRVREATVACRAHQLRVRQLEDEQWGLRATLLLGMQGREEAHGQEEVINTWIAAWRANRLMDDMRDRPNKQRREWLCGARGGPATTK